MLAEVKEERFGNTSTVAVFLASEDAGLALGIHSIRPQHHSEIHERPLNGKLSPVNYPRHSHLRRLRAAC